MIRIGLPKVAVHGTVPLMAAGLVSALVVLLFATSPAKADASASDCGDWFSENCVPGWIRLTSPTNGSTIKGDIQLRATVAVTDRACRVPEASEMIFRLMQEGQSPTYSDRHPATGRTFVDTANEGQPDEYDYYEYSLDIPTDPKLDRSFYVDVHATFICPLDAYGSQNAMTVWEERLEEYEYGDTHDPYTRFRVNNVEPPPPPPADTTKPAVKGTAPLAGATGVLPGANLTATFSEKMQKATVTKSTFKLSRVTSSGTTQVTNATVTLSSDGLKATLNPFGTSTTKLAKNAKYKATVTTGARDLAGNALDQNRSLSGNQAKSWTFTVQR